MKTFISVIVIVLIFLMGLMVGNKISSLFKNYNIVDRSEYEELVRIKDFYSNHLYRDGWNDEFGSYRLRSFDDGVSWYVFDADTLLGNADSIYPGLIKHIEAWDNITKFVKENGTINETNYKLLESDLNEVGITIE